MSGHISPKTTYYAIFGSLMVLTAVTVIVAFINLGSLNFPVALSIAIVKATLVILYWFTRGDRRDGPTWAATGLVIAWFAAEALLGPRLPRSAAHFSPRRTRPPDARSRSSATRSGRAATRRIPRSSRAPSRSMA